MLFRQSFFFSLKLSLFFCTSVKAEKEEKNDAFQAKQSIEMSYGDATVYGLVEGVTEFLPISSTGHLILTKELLTDRAELQIWTSKDGSIQKGEFVRLGPNHKTVLIAVGSEKEKVRLNIEDLSEESKDMALRLFDQNSALDSYLIVIQAGAILAVTLIYRKQIWSILLGFFGLDPRGKRLGVNLLMAFLPAALLGPILDDLIEGYLLFPVPIACALFVGALLMFWVEKKRKNENSFAMADSGKSLDDLTLRSSLSIGLLQCVAMWPGTSRSMMTIVGGYLVGLSRAKAAEFSFLLGLITLTAAACYKCLTKWESMRINLELGPVLWGCLVAGASAAVSVVWLVGYLSRRGLGVFVWYRVILSLVILYFYVS